ncbi:MAG: glutathione S-transferase family protein [Caulobacteraceae bacterium]
MLELYHWEPTANSGEVLILLHEKGLDYAGRYIDVLKGEQFSPAFLEVNRFGQVPVLVHDGHTITETGIILQYLEETFGEVCLTPESAQDRYWAEVWIKYVNEYMAPAAWKLGVSKAKPAPLPADVLARAPIERQQAWAKTAEGFSDDELEFAKGLLPVRLERMEAALASSDWLAGPTYSLADIAVYPTAAILPALTPDLVNAEATPRVLAWLERMASRPAVKAALAEARTPDPKAAFAPGPEGGRWG